MAVTSTIAYCEDRDLEDVFPHISEYSLKRRIINFKSTDTPNQYQAFATGLITQLYFDGIEGTAVTDDPNADYEFNYSTTTDSVQVFHSSTSPNDMVIEAGDDWADVKQRTRRKASRFIESYLDSRMSREIMKDREGNYPEIIVHATALQTIVLLLKAHEPNSEVVESFQAELDEILEGLKSGSIVLPSRVTSDSSKGVIREVSINSNSDLRPVQLKGNYNQWGYDLIKLKVITGGVIGTSTYSVWVKDSNTLKTNQVITEEKITGDYDHLVSNLYVRFSGDDVTSAITTANDEYEIEVHSSAIDSGISSVGSMSMTRR
jgi:hypothetical protein